MKLRSKPADSNKRIVSRNKLGERGVAAVEFALIAPIMVLMLFGSTELTQAITIDRKVTIAASTIADLVTQGSTLDCTVLKNADAITREVFAPYDTQGDTAKITVASVALDGTTPKVEWSRTVDSGGNCVQDSAYPAGATVNVSGTDAGGNTVNLISSMLTADNAIIIGDVELKYESIGTKFIRQYYNMGERFFFRPRKSDKICYTGITTSGC